MLHVVYPKLKDPTYRVCLLHLCLSMSQTQHFWLAGCYIKVLTTVLSVYNVRKVFRWHCNERIIADLLFMINRAVRMKSWHAEIIVYWTCQAFWRAPVCQQKLQSALLKCYFTAYVQSRGGFQHHFLAAFLPCYVPKLPLKIRHNVMHAI